MSTRLWHPFADMALVKEGELVVARGEDVWIWDTEGRRYLDATASLWYANVGHGRKEIAAAVAEQIGRLEAYSTFADFATEPALMLADRLAALAPVQDGKVFLGSGGGDAIEAAAKLVRLYWQAVGQPQRVHLVARRHAYHGSHGFGTTLGGIEPNRVGYAPLPGGISHVDHDSVGAYADELNRLGPENVAALFLEPVIGSGGVHPPPEGYLEGMAELCREAGVLLVVDAVICGFGRLGTWFGIERWDVDPDIVVFAKGVTSGYLPLGGMVVGATVAEPFWSEPGRMFRNGVTYAGHAACCAAAMANLDILEREGLIPRGRELEGALLAALAPLVEHEAVAEVRGGVGLMAAVEVDADLRQRRPRAVAELAAHVRDAGVIVRPQVAAVSLSPPLTVTEEHLSQIGAALRVGLDRLVGAAVPA
jgi:putrescine---pyruvate transaminase